MNTEDKLQKDATLEGVSKEEYTSITTFSGTKKAKEPLGQYIPPRILFPEYAAFYTLLIYQRFLSRWLRN
ncbi:hypothetical protein [Priestia megaterium]